MPQHHRKKTQTDIVDRRGITIIYTSNPQAIPIFLSFFLLVIPFTSVYRRKKMKVELSYQLCERRRQGGIETFNVRGRCPLKCYLYAVELDEQSHASQEQRESASPSLALQEYACNKLYIMNIYSFPPVFFFIYSNTFVCIPQRFVWKLIIIIIKEDFFFKQT